MSLSIFCLVRRHFVFIRWTLRFLLRHGLAHCLHVVAEDGAWHLGSPGVHPQGARWMEQMQQEPIKIGGTDSTFIRSM